MIGHARSRRQVLEEIVTGVAISLPVIAAWHTANAQPVRELGIVAKRFKFVPNEIQLKVGEPVLLLIRSLDYIHGFNVPDLGIRADLLPGLVTSIPMTPAKVGRLDFLCDNFCGDSHEEMHGQFNVVA